MSFFYKILDVLFFDKNRIKCYISPIEFLFNQNKHIMKSIFKVIILLITVLTVSFITKEKEPITVVIDVSHGGEDTGATHDEFTEKEIVNAISNKLKELHKDKNVTLHFTRTADEFIALETRTSMINKINPDLLISLHVNANENTKANGVEIYYSDKSILATKSQQMGQRLSNTLQKNLPLENRGVKVAPFYILSKATVPAITLEIGFISNENDRTYMTSENGQKEIAVTLLDFISNIK